MRPWARTLIISFKKPGSFPSHDINTKEKKNGRDFIISPLKALLGYKDLTKSRGDYEWVSQVVASLKENIYPHRVSDSLSSTVHYALGRLLPSITEIHPDNSWPPGPVQYLLPLPVVILSSSRQVLLAPETTKVPDEVWTLEGRLPFRLRPTLSHQPGFFHHEINFLRAVFLCSVCVCVPHSMANHIKQDLQGPGPCQYSCFLCLILGRQYFLDYYRCWSK